MLKRIDKLNKCGAQFNAIELSYVQRMNNYFIDHGRVDYIGSFIKEATNRMTMKRSVAMSHRRKDMNRMLSSFRFKKTDMRSLHLNNENGSSSRFFPLFVLMELRWNEEMGQISPNYFHAAFPTFRTHYFTELQKSKTIRKGKFGLLPSLIRHDDDDDDEVDSLRVNSTFVTKK